MQLRPVLLALWAAFPITEGAAAHNYTQAERYAGCLYGAAIPMMRRGTDRERALSIASDRCLVWSEGLSSSDIREVDVEIHRAIELTERSGL